MTEMSNPIAIGQLLAQVSDPYDRNARLAPGLIVLMPLTVSFIAAFRDELDAMQVVAAVVVTFCAPFLLSSVVRFQGKKLENKLVKKWGGMPSTILLRHRDERLNPVTKARYHDAINEKLKAEVPSAAKERGNPSRADHAYEDAVAKLRERTRGTESLVLKENISYGFFRNMSALRPFGVVTSAAGVVVGLLLTGALTLNPLAFNWATLLHPGFEGGATLLVSGFLLYLWVTNFTHGRVESAAYAYAERLLTALDRIPSSSSP
ncbi:hypothetical protein RKE57_06110 [Stenotrophomonas geniculata]|uniref:hypothetical protein n=1 Tax=Stenotrophomonas geniculata TaxID=86188 RepID=UPI00287FF032|nr:hypothetical protein [Stenotrophomonas geniculata]WNF11710.1 hypothetical protein RKE57_06110 [Stenotrophomonas geniculata]